MPKEQWTFLTQLSNDRQSDLKLILEPWGDEHVVAPSEWIEILFLGPAGLPLISVLEDAIEIHGWVGSILEVTRNGKVPDGAELRPPVPEVPPGYRP